MSRKARVILNVLGLQAGWFVCVMSGAGGYPWIAVAFVGGHIAIHLVSSPSRARDGIVIALTGVAGIGADAVLLAVGAIGFEAGVIGGWVIPIWMIALWVNFATSLNLTLEFLHRRYVLAGLFGALGGSMAYVGGVKFGALNMPWGLWQGGSAVAWEWAVVTPLLCWMARGADRRWGRTRMVAESAEIAVV